MHYVVLALHAHLAFFLGARFAAAGDEIDIGNSLRADETLFKIDVDDTRRLGRGLAFVNRP